MAKIVKGVQLPPDSTGSITGGFTVTEHDDQTGDDNEIVLPATVIVDAEGEEIGTALIHELSELNRTMAEMLELQKLIHEALSR